MEKLWHQTIQRVRYQETDQMGVVHHANYVSWFETGRTEWIRSSGIAYSRLESLGILLPVVDLSITFHRPAHYDECVAIFTAMTDFSAVRLKFEYEVRRLDPASCPDLVSVEQPAGMEANRKGMRGELLTSGTSMHIWLNREWKPARIDKAAPEMYALLQSKSGFQANES